MTESLTQREKDCIQQLFLGKSNDEIAHALGVTLTSVKHTLGAAYAKLGVSDARGLFPLVIASQSEKLMAVAE